MMQIEHKSPKDMEYNANIEGRAATEYEAAIHVFVFPTVSPQKVSKHGIGLGSSGALEAENT